LEVGLSRSKKTHFPGCNGVRFLLVGFLVEVADKKELLWLLLDFFGMQVGSRRVVL